MAESEYYAKNRDRLLARAADYRARPGHAERNREYQKAWRARNQVALQAKDREKYQRTKDYRIAQAKAYYAAHTSQVLAGRKARYWADPEKARAMNKTPEAKQRKNAKRRAWALANPEHTRAMNTAFHLKRHYRMTVADYAAMVERQQGQCAICGETPTGKGRAGKLYVDHDHATGDIRGLLCSNCNAGLGQFKDNQHKLTRAAWYIEAHRQKARSA